jgi:hypothetical protein
MVDELDTRQMLSLTPKTCFSMVTGDVQKTLATMPTRRQAILCGIEVRT